MAVAIASSRCSNTSIESSSMPASRASSCRRSGAIARGESEADRYRRNVPSEASTYSSRMVSNMPSASFSPRMPTTACRCESLNASVSAAAEARTPCGLWPASRMVSGSVRTTSRRPGERTDSKAARTTSSGS